jgi:hypothetical protein
MERMPGTLVGCTTTAGGAEGWRRWDIGGDIGSGTGLRASSMEDAAESDEEGKQSV